MDPNEYNPILEDCPLYHKPEFKALADEIERHLNIAEGLMKEVNKQWGQKIDPDVPLPIIHRWIIHRNRPHIIRYDT